MMNDWQYSFMTDISILFTTMVMWFIFSKEKETKYKILNFIVGILLGIGYVLLFKWKG